MTKNKNKTLFRHSTAVSRGLITYSQKGIQTAISYSINRTNHISMLELHNTINMHKKDKWMYLLQDSKITKFFLDSAEVEGDLNLANNS